MASKEVSDDLIGRVALGVFVSMLATFAVRWIDKKVMENKGV